MLIALCIAAAIVGGALVWLAMEFRARLLLARERALVAAIRKLNHDLRGALSPALLLAESLESNVDPAVVRTAVGIAKALERAAEIGGDAALLAGSRRPVSAPSGRTAPTAGQPQRSSR